MSRALIVGLCASNAALLVALLFLSRKRLHTYLTAATSSATKHDHALGELLGRDYKPPLPHPIPQVLDEQCLCFLATTSELSPHLSLMRFSYCKSLEDPEGEVMIMSTQRNTKKYTILKENKNVALLVHGFESGRESDVENYNDTGKSRYSITLNGEVKEEQGELAEAYRAFHLQRNSEYSQFIVGDDIAVISVKLTSARVCDVNDSKPLPAPVDPRTLRFLTCACCCGSGAPLLARTRLASVGGGDPAEQPIDQANASGNVDEVLSRAEAAASVMYLRIQILRLDSVAYTRLHRRAWLAEPRVCLVRKKADPH